MRKNFGTKSWFYPLPVLIIGTYDESGAPDAMNAAWGGLYDADKIVLCLSASHKTTKNIQAKGAFTVSFADAAHIIPADYVGMVSANNTPQKMAKSGFHTTRSEFVDAPLVNELPVALECRFLKVNEDGNWTWANSIRSPSSRQITAIMCWASAWAMRSAMAAN